MHDDGNYAISRNYAIAWGSAGDDVVRLTK